MSSFSEDEFDVSTENHQQTNFQPSNFSINSPIGSFSSSRVSSPFEDHRLPQELKTSISNTEQHNQFEDYTQEYSQSFKSQDGSVPEIEMDKSIASLKSTLADMRINTKSLSSLRSQKEQDYGQSPDVRSQYDQDNTEETINTTKDHSAQFHNDINLDKGSFQSTKSASPWRKMRSSAYSPAPAHLTLPPVAPLRFGSDGKVSSSDSSSSAGTINELNKQLTSYKMQIRFFKQFLQKLIEEDNGLDLSELTMLRDSLSPFKRLNSQSSANTEPEVIPKDKLVESEPYIKLEADYQNLSTSYDEIFKLNEDLYTSLEQFQTRLQTKDETIDELKHTIDSCIPIVNDIIEALIIDARDPTTQKALQSCGDSDVTLDTKLKAILHDIGRRTQKTFELERASTHSSGSITVVDREKQFEINNYIKTIHQLMSTLEQLRNEFDGQNKLVDNMKKELNFEIEQSEQLRENNTMMKQSLDNITDIIDQTMNMSNSRELEHLKHENQRLGVLNSTMNKKFEGYQRVIDQLQNEVRDIQSLNANNANATQHTQNRNISELNEELLQSHRDFNKLQEDFNDLHNKYVKLKEDSSNTISSLTNQLHVKKQESSSLRADKVVSEKAQQELNIAVERQRTLKAEKIRLTYKVESLTKDKIALQTTIQNLTDKVTDLTVSDSQNSRIEDDSAVKRINILEYQIAELLQLDTVKFQKLLKSFNKIADDVSLKEPTRKVDYMSSALIPNNSSDPQVDFTDMNTIKEYHKSVFDYFARAVDVIVNDHVKLLLKESEETTKSSEYVNKLHQRIDELNRLNDEISRSFESQSVATSRNSSVVDLDIGSPRARLRIEELTSRWKAEREARVYENNEAEARLKELESENSRLREMISRTEFSN